MNEPESNTKKVLRFLGKAIAFPFKLIRRFLGWLFHFRRLGKLWTLEHIVLAVIAIILFTPVPPLVRDVTYVLYAHHQEQKALRVAQDAHCRAGDEEACVALKRHDLRLPFQADYGRAAVYDPDTEWATVTNSIWLADHMRLILPYFTYENVSGLTNGRYPMVVAFFPFGGEFSLHVLGTVPDNEALWVLLNERLVLDPRWNDEVEAEAVLIHELIHVQGGKYLEWPPSTWEAYTSAATLEVEAGMCNYGDPVACAAFWKDFEGMVRGTLKYAAMSAKVPWLYDAFADVFLRSDEETIWARKQARFYHDHGEDLEATLYKYDYKPWHELVVPQFSGHTMRTGHIRYDLSGAAWYNQMFADDMVEMLGPMGWLARIIRN